VWGLQSGYRWAYCLSRQRDTEVMLFWSDETFAHGHATKEWEGHIPTPIDLSIFIENWLSVLQGDEVLIGLDFDKDLAGPEIEPGELAKALMAAS